MNTLQIVELVVLALAFLSALYAAWGMRQNTATLAIQQEEINNTFDLVARLCEKQGWISKEDISKASNKLLNISTRSTRILVANQTEEMLMVNKLELKPGASCTATFDSNDFIHIHSDIGSVILSNSNVCTYVSYGRIGLQEGPEYHFIVVANDKN